MKVKERKLKIMTKLELVEVVSSKAEITKAEAHKVVDAGGHQRGPRRGRQGYSPRLRLL